MKECGMNVAGEWTTEDSQVIEVVDREMADYYIPAVQITLHNGTESYYHLLGVCLSRNDARKVIQKEQCRDIYSLDKAGGATLYKKNSTTSDWFATFSIERLTTEKQGEEL